MVSCCARQGRVQSRRSLGRIGFVVIGLTQFARFVPFMVRSDVPDPDGTIANKSGTVPGYNPTQTTKAPANYESRTFHRHDPRPVCARAAIDFSAGSRRLDGRQQWRWAAAGCDSAAGCHAHLAARAVHRQSESGSGAATVRPVLRHGAGKRISLDQSVLLADARFAAGSQLREQSSQGQRPRRQPDRDRGHRGMASGRDTAEAAIFDVDDYSAVHPRANRGRHSESGHAAHPTMRIPTASFRCARMAARSPAI